MNDDDDAMRRRMRRADPARDVAPAAIERLDRITETIMSSSIHTTNQTTDHTEPAASATPGRRLVWVISVAVAGAAAAVAAAVVIGTGGAGSPTRLLAPEAVGPATSCAVITAEGLAMNDLAFAATVTGIEGDEVALTVSERFRGEVGDTVVVAQGTDPNLEYSTGQFAEGQSYLVAVTGDAAASCGLTGPDSPELRALYEEAFRG